MAQQLKITQIRSAIGRPSAQRLVLRGLGLRKVRQSKVLEDTLAIRGMIRKVQHLVSVASADG